MVRRRPSLSTGANQEQVAIILTDGEGAQCRASMAERLAAEEVEAPFVQRADHRAIGRYAIGQRPAPVWTGRLAREPPRRSAKDRQGATIDTDQSALAHRYVVDRAEADHGSSPSGGGPTGASAAPSAETSSRSPNWRGW